MLYCVAVCCGVCSVLQCAAVNINHSMAIFPFGGTEFLGGAGLSSVLQDVAGCCRLFLCAAQCCSEYHSMAIFPFGGTEFFGSAGLSRRVARCCRCVVAVCCSVLQSAAVCFNSCVYVCVCFFCSVFHYVAATSLLQWIAVHVWVVLCVCVCERERERLRVCVCHP